VAVPSFVEGLQRGRGWIDQAHCRQAPNDALPWIMEASTGKLRPVATVRLLDVCARCPVRWECLLDAVTERAFTVTGCFGGSMVVAVVEQETRRFKAERAAEPIVFRERSPDQRPRSVVPSQERLTDRGEHQIRMRATGSSKRASPSGWRAGSVEPTSTDEPSGCCHARARAAASSSSQAPGFSFTAPSGAR
jgi:hypothetical protein